MNLPTRKKGETIATILIIGPLNTKKDLRALLIKDWIKIQNTAAKNTITYRLMTLIIMTTKIDGIATLNIVPSAMKKTNALSTQHCQGHKWELLK